MHHARPETEPTVRVMDGLRRAVRALRAGNVDAERELGVSVAQLFVLRQIADVPGISVAQLAGRTHTAQSSVSEVVARLVAEHYVTKAPATDDRRRAALTVTAKGRAVTARAGRTVQERLIEALNRLPRDDRRRFADLFEDWLREAGLEDVPATMFFEPSPRRSPAGRPVSPRSSGSAKQEP